MTQELLAGVWREAQVRSGLCGEAYEREVAKLCASTDPEKRGLDYWLDVAGRIGEEDQDG